MSIMEPLILDLKQDFMSGQGVKRVLFKKTNWILLLKDFFAKSREPPDCSLLAKCELTAREHSTPSFIDYAAPFL